MKSSQNGSCVAPLGTTWPIVAFRNSTGSLVGSCSVYSLLASMTPLMPRGPTNIAAVTRRAPTWNELFRYLRTALEGKAPGPLICAWTVAPYAPQIFAYLRKQNQNVQVLWARAGMQQCPKCTPKKYRSNACSAAPLLLDPGLQKT